jgi:Flp pilus assembly protein TadG
MSKKTSKFCRFSEVLHKEQKGSSSIEFALTFLLILLVTFGMIEFCSAIYTYTVLSDAANEGLRYLIVNSSDAPGFTNTQSKVTTYASYSWHDTTSGIHVSVTCPSCAPGSTATVAVSYAYVPYLSWIMSSPPTMTAHAEGTVVN